ncbi:translational GTPase TypA [Candidatus Uhrbacteria bacterium]|nr:translational GTPase TypA [Candidatus Uhrbacteria bacterium]
MEFRNIAIIAHVDHGKTTLVDAMLRQSGTFSDREVVEERVMDSNVLERERGITIYSKNTAIRLGDVKVNIVDTPGHADFGSEVERVLRMVDSVLLLVDAQEGPMPQTRFVLRKSLELGLKPIVIINKIDKPAAQPDRVLNQVFDLFVELGATDEQMDFEVLYAISRDGIAKRNPEDESADLQPLFDTILNRVPPAPSDPARQMRMQPANLAYDEFVGRMGSGRIYEGTIRVGQTVTVIKHDGSRERHKISKIMVSDGLQRKSVPEAVAGDIAMVAGIPNINVGETIAENPEAVALPTISIDRPTLSMSLMINDSPFAGREGKFVTSRQIRERLERELETNVGLEIEFPEGGDLFKISGRGEMHLAVLIETMRREGYEMQVSQPQVITRLDGNGQPTEPYETVTVDVPDEFSGTVIEKLGRRKGEMRGLKSENGLTRLEYSMPTRGLLGLRMEFMTDTRGEGTLSHVFSHYGPHCGPIVRRSSYSIISMETGKALAYALNNIQERGTLFIGPGTEVYAGMVIGSSMRDTMVVNPIKGKKLTNMRASGSDDSVQLAPPLTMTLERALEFINDDEYVEVTPQSVRIRKQVLDETERKRIQRKTE